MTMNGTQLADSFISGGDKFYLVMIDGFIVYKCNAQCSKNVVMRARMTQIQENIRDSRSFRVGEV